MPTTKNRLPKNLSVSLNDIEHGYTISATAQVAWSPIGETGGPLTVAFWPDALVMYTPSNSGSYPNLRFYLRGVAYNVRAEYRRQPDGSWSLKPFPMIDRSDWTRVSEMHASDAARRDLTAILEEVGRQIVEARPDLFRDAAVAEARKDLDKAHAEVTRLETELADARDTVRNAEAALHAAEATRWGFRRGYA